MCGLNTSGFIAEGDYYQMCTVNYIGNWIPVMQWTGGNEQNVYAQVLYFNTPTRVTSSIAIRLESSENGVTFTCKTSFDPMATVNGNNRPGEALATRFQYVWSVIDNIWA